MRDRLREIIETRAHDPGAIGRAAARRVKAASPLGDGGRAMIIAADHPARGALAAGGDPTAMADRGELLERLCVALARPGVTGVLGTADILEDLLLLGVLDGKTVFGSMNRGGLAGSGFEIDDRFTGCTADGIAAMGFDGGKMLTRIALEDPATPSILESSARAVDALAERRLMAMVEPFLSVWEDGRLRNDLSPDAVIKSVAIASGLGTTSARTWLKLPVVAEMERVLAATTLPVLLLGGEVRDADAAFASWKEALAQPIVRGLVVGRSLLYPADDDVAGAVDRAVGLL
ncbi:Cgl0159 family (beta/alpha)8-fold protein [Actinomadura rudentiformis]|uniref:Aldolase n=1 Tax=Actinomadura rudentiformis TaxID=359158 RepID=A0A6H9YY80_9ACTN|nr:aldolase [Actinomadura rudentiformis]KAB2352404.1 aldolase [Actinomadura rudentiformis]